MKTMKYITALLLAFALLFSAAACDKNRGSEPDPDPGITEPAPDENAVLTHEDAKALMDEKLTGELDGYTSEFSEALENHYVFSVCEPEGNEVARIAIDKTSGELSAYNANGTFSPYEESALFVSPADMICDWNGTFEGSDFTIELIQEDISSFYFAFSDGLSGNARILGNTGVYDGTPNLLFVISPDENTLSVFGNGESYEGVYAMSE